MPREELIAAVSEFFAAPRFITALTTSIVGVGVCSFALRQLVGWAGLVGILSTLVILAGLSIAARWESVEWRGLLPISLIAFVGWAGASVFWSEYTWSTIAGLAYLVTFTVLGLYVALNRDTIQIVRAFGDVLRFVLSVSIAVEVIAGLLLDAPIGFLRVLGQLDVLGPIQGVAGARNELGIVALVALVTFGIEFRTHLISRGLSIGSLVLAGAVLLLTRSPVAIGAFALVCLAGAALYGLRRAQPDRRAILQVGLLVAVVVAAALAWSFRSALVSALSASGELRYRLEIWRTLLDLSTLNSLQGWGWIGMWRDDIAPFQVFSGLAPGPALSASNAFLDIWFQLGIVGLAIFIGLVGLAVVRSWLLASQRRSVVFAWPALVLVGLVASAFAESSLLIEFGWLTLVVCTVKAAQQLSWRRAFS